MDDETITISRKDWEAAHLELAKLREEMLRRDGPNGQLADDVMAATTIIHAAARIFSSDSGYITGRGKTARLMLIRKAIFAVGLRTKIGPPAIVTALKRHPSIARYYIWATERESQNNKRFASMVAELSRVVC
jgi:hypothetical protein